MKMTYTTAEARKVLRVDAKTFDRWLEQAGMQPQISRWNHRIKHFTQEQVLQLAEEHGRFIPVDEDMVPCLPRQAAYLSVERSFLTKPTHNLMDLPTF